MSESIASRMHKSTEPMHKTLEQIPRRILIAAQGALAQANHNAIFYDPYLEHWDYTCVLNAATAGELFLKAIIAKEHPLLVFSELKNLYDQESTEIDVEMAIKNGKTHGFDVLPKVLWVTTGERLPHQQSFEELRQTRNAMQHFCAPDKSDLRGIALRFIYYNIDPLIERHFGLNVIEFHEDDPGIGYDYVVGVLLAREIVFSVPTNFDLAEFGFYEELSVRSDAYQDKMYQELKRKGIDIRKITGKGPR